MVNTKPSGSTQSLTILYVASLSSVAMLAILGQVIVQRILANQAADMQIVQIAENQQALSQQIGKAALMVQFSVDEAERQQHLENLQKTIASWQQSRQTLHDRALSLKSGDRRAEAERMFTDMEPASQKIENTATQLMTIASDLSNASLSNRRRTLQDRILPGDRGRTIPYIRQILAAEANFHAEMKGLIESYERKGAEGIARLRQLELGLTAVTLSVLVLEGLLVFRPAVAQIQEAVTALEAALEETRRTAQQLAAEQAQSERLLLNILPEPIASRLKQEESAIADGFAEATVLFADIVGFTQLSTRLAPQALVNLLNQIFSRFDELTEKHGLEKIKTIGDAYMVVGGLPDPRPDHAAAIAEMALDMQGAIEQFNQDTQETFSIRIGINSGPVIAGVIGIKKFIYDLWGDTVNTASRMESHGKPGEIQVTDSTYEYLKDLYDLEPRGVVHIKGKGDMPTYWLKGKKEAAAWPVSS